jgi:dTDP-glucose pyrophosphorylase
MKDIGKLLIKRQSTILEALRIIDQGTVQIALVVDDNNVLQGTLTDGDVRRGILRGVSLNDSVDVVMHAQPTVATEYESEEIIYAKIKKNGLKHIPVVNKAGQVTRLFLLNELVNRDRKDNWVVLMAGGLGTRLGMLTKDCPKPLLKVGSKPILEIIVENFISSGFYRFVISVNYRAEMIMEYFGDGSRWGIEIVYVKERKRLGTAGALSLLPFRPEKPFIVMNADLLTKVNFTQLLDFHLDTEAKATMCVREYEFQVPYGVVSVNKHQLQSIEEKPTQRFFISGGIYILNPELIDWIPQDSYYDMPTLFERLIAKDETSSAFPIREYWLDIGRMDDFNRANNEYFEMFG